MFFSEFAAQVIDVHAPLGTPGAPSGKYSWSAGLWPTTLDEVDSNERFSILDSMPASM